MLHQDFTVKERHNTCTYIKKIEDESTECRTKQKNPGHFNLDKINGYEGEYIDGSKYHKILTSISMNMQGNGHKKSNGLNIDLSHNASKLSINSTRASVVSKASS